MADHGLGLDLLRGLIGCLREQILDVERAREHLHAAATGGPLPALARPVNVDLDSKAVGIAEVKGLGDAVV